MLLAVAAQSTDADSPVSPNLGRCPAFVLVRLEEMSFQGIANPAAASGSGAGVQAAEMLVRLGVGGVISGSVGPNAFTILQRAGTDMFAATSGTVRNNIDAYLAGTLTRLGAASAPAHGSRDLSGGMPRRGDSPPPSAA
ncbi:MAG: NifB/NifX family molybdenum-iron cluster-binding protein [Anaerolineae bacterium]